MEPREIDAERARAEPAWARRELDRGRPLLLRGCHWSVPEFERWTGALCAGFHEVGTRQRLRQEAGDGYTTEVFRHNFALLGHSEGAYRPWPAPPDVCFFLCLEPPAAAGGETTLIDGAELLRRLAPELRELLRATPVSYLCRWPRERWQAEFGLADAAAVAQRLAAVAGCSFSFDADEVLQLQWRTSALRRSRDGSEVFANGILAHLPRLDHPRHAGRGVYVNPNNGVLLGDAPLDSAVLEALVDAHDQVLVRHRWRAGDLLVIDNTRWMHGREPTAAPCPRVILSRFGRFGRVDAAPLP